MIAGRDRRRAGVAPLRRPRARDPHAQGAARRARRTGAQEVWALRDVSLHVAPGEAVGLVGRNGSGKSTLLRLIAGIIRPTTGTVSAGGRVGSLLELGAGLPPGLHGSRERRAERRAPGADAQRAIRERFDEIVAFAELEHAIDRPVRTYSSGMTMRLGFAIAAFLEADVLLLDEVFAVGDESFQRKCFGVISAFKQRGGTILFVSHDASAVERLCDRAVLLRGGSGGVRRPGARGARPLPARARRGRGRARRRERRGSGRPTRRSSARASSTPTARPRERFLAGEPIALELEVVGHRAPPRRGRVHLELRDAAGLLVVDERRRARHARLGRAAPGALAVRLELPRPAAPVRSLPARARAPRRRRPAGAPRRRRAAAARLPRRRRPRARPSRRNVERRREGGHPMSYKTCPDWPDADGARARPPVQAHDRCARRSSRSRSSRSSPPSCSLDEIEICCDVEHHVVHAGHTHPGGRRRARRHALVRGARVGDVRPRRRSAGASAA